jgi:hypothetical protein
MDRDERTEFLHDVDEFCKELRPIEEVCYVEHSFNDQLIPLAKKYDLLGIPVRKEYGSRGADAVTSSRRSILDFNFTETPAPLPTASNIECDGGI